MTKTKFLDKTSYANSQKTVFPIININRKIYNNEDEKADVIISKKGEKIKQSKFKVMKLMKY